MGHGEDGMSDFVIERANRIDVGRIASGCHVPGNDVAAPSATSICLMKYNVTKLKVM
jgi:hypothetical protein